MYTETLELHLKTTAVMPHSTSENLRDVFEIKLLLHTDVCGDVSVHFDDDLEDLRSTKDLRRLVESIVS